MSSVTYADGEYKITDGDGETIVNWLNDNGDIVKIKMASNEYTIHFYSETIPWVKVTSSKSIGQALSKAKDILRTEKIRKEYKDGYGSAAT